MSIEMTISEEVAGEPDIVKFDSGGECVDVATVAEGGRLDQSQDPPERLEANDQNESDEFQSEVAKASAEVAAAAVEWSKARDAAKSAKKRFDAAVDELQLLIERGPESMPLFDGKAKAAKEQVSDRWPSVNSEREYEQMLRSASLSDLELTRDGKKVSLKGSVEKLADTCVATIWDWEQLRKNVDLGKAEYPKRLRRNDIEEAVANWVTKNWSGGRPADEQNADRARVIDSDIPPHAYLRLASLGIEVLALYRSVANALEADGITNLDKLRQQVEADTPSDRMTADEWKHVTVLFWKYVEENWDDLTAEDEAEDESGNGGNGNDSEAVPEACEAMQREVSVDDL